jgi:hypothetical protein
MLEMKGKYISYELFYLVMRFTLDLLFFSLVTYALK